MCIFFKYFLYTVDMIVLYTCINKSFNLTYRDVGRTMMRRLACTVSTDIDVSKIACQIP